MKKHLLKLTALLAVCTTFAADRFLHLISFSKRTVSLFVLVLLVSSGMMAQYPKTITFTAVNNDFVMAGGSKTIEDCIKATTSGNVPNVSAQLNGVGLGAHPMDCVGSSGNAIDFNNVQTYIMFETLNPNEKITSIKVIYKANSAAAKVSIVYGEDISAPATVDIPNGAANTTGVFTITNGDYHITDLIAQGTNSCDALAFPFPSDVHKVILSKRLFWRGEPLEPNQYARYIGSATGLNTIVSDGESGSFVIGAVILTVEPLVNCEAPDDVEISGKNTYFQNYTAEPLTATPTGGDGTFIYKWYSNTTGSNEGGTPITGAVSDEYTPPVSATGTIYYYCEVCGTKSEPYGVTVDTAPKAIPEVDTETTCNSIPIKWGAVTGALSYQLFISTTTDVPSAYVATVIPPADLEYEFTGLTSDTPYYIYVNDKGFQHV